MAKPPNKKTKQAYQRAVEFGCVVCKKHYGLRTEPTIHHLTGGGMALKSKKFIPLCHEHHQGNQGVHHNTKVFEERFGTQEELLDWYLQNINE